MECCPLCAASADHFFEDDWRRYFRCARCRLVFVDRAQLPSRAEERRTYDLHENDPSDSGYRAFLSRLFEPLNQCLKPNSTGLDFGCGPGPTLSMMFEEVGHEVSIYDPHYYPDKSVLAIHYDFITATEVAEHLHHPGEVLNNLWSLLHPGGYLGLMTSFVPTHFSFDEWHYRTDPTHISFFSPETFEWLADEFRAALTLEGRSVAILKKQEKEMP